MVTERQPTPSLTSPGDKEPGEMLAVGGYLRVGLDVRTRMGTTSNL